MNADCEVAIIGAGPYGLSAAAHLKTKGTSVRVFGEPMKFWADMMPEGMLLRSPREASSLSDPGYRFTLEQYEAASGLSVSVPVPLSRFVQYGRWFSETIKPVLDRRQVASVRRAASGFALMLDDGQQLIAPRVVVAAGVGPFARKPDVFGQLDGSLASHCYEGADLRRFNGKRVTVIGAGQSALESAALLHEIGAQVEVISRIQNLRWIGKHVWLHRLGPISAALYSKYDVGPIGISRLVSMPNVVRHIPQAWRDKIRTRAVRPAGAKWLPDRLTGVKFTLGQMVTDANETGGVAKLTLSDGSERTTDHVLMGTGYNVNLERYSFLAADLRSQIACAAGYPLLDTGFTSSLPGLHFVGAAAARTFGPLLYFVAGTDFTSHALASYIWNHRSKAQMTVAAIA